MSKIRILRLMRNGSQIDGSGNPRAVANPVDAQWLHDFAMVAGRRVGGVP